MLSFFKKIANKIYPDGQAGKLFRRTLKPASFYMLSKSTKPISNCYGFDRGTPIDRYFIENFLSNNKDNIRGACLEVLNNIYTKRFGGEKIIKSDVLDIDPNNKSATIIGDIRNLENIPDSAYDCIILTQVLQFIDNVESAVSECHRILKKDGVIMATLPTISRIDCSSGIKGDFWRFTKASAEYIFLKQFTSANLEISSFGNVRSGMYFFAGLSLEEIPKKILNDNDSDFPTIITVKAFKK